MHSHTPQDNRAFKRLNSDESAGQPTGAPREHSWSAKQAMLAAFLLFVVVVALSQVL